MMAKPRVSSLLLLRLFPSSVSVQQSPSAAGGSPCPGTGAGPGSAQAVTSLSVGSWGSRKGDDALAWAGGSCPDAPALFWQWAV